VAPQPRIGILLLQVGTPDAPTPWALRRYLHEFLRDRRVVDLPRAQWWPILYLGVLPRRPAQSARLYKKIWTADGSPLAVITQAQAGDLAARLRGSHGAVPVAVGMRYGRPSIATAVDELIAAGCDRILAFPMYPQYAGATTGSSFERLFQILGGRRVVPSVRTVASYFDAPEYIAALAESVRDALGAWPPDHVLISFHGLPKRFADLGDPYADHCHETAGRLAAAMHWPADRVTVSFQSLFGREEWLRPYTDETLRRLAARRIPRLAVVCPGFTADCLETLEEMGMTNRELYEAAGGGEYRLVPCLNTHAAWIEAMAAIVRRQVGGWDPNAGLKTTGLRRPARLEPRTHALPRQEDEQAVVQRRSLPADPPRAGQSH
jgi:protoporphyrin/coproporphyrin ferrochelatase